MKVMQSHRVHIDQTVVTGPNSYTNLSSEPTAAPSILFVSQLRQAVISSLAMHGVAMTTLHSPTSIQCDNFRT